MARKAPKTAFKPGQSGNPTGRKKGVPNKATKEIRELARSILERPKALQHLRDQADRGTLNPTVHVTLMHYAYGKPKDTVQHEGLIEVLRVVVEGE